MAFDPLQLFCLASAVYFEARSQTIAEQILVAQVVMERVYDPRYPDDICQVVWENSGRRTCSFSWACDGADNSVTETGAWAQALSVALGVMSGVHVREARGYTLFYSGDTHPWWALSDKTRCNIKIGEFTACKED